MPIAPETRLGPYEIVAPLGAGGMGEVYRARDTRLGRDVALKILPHEVASDPIRRQRFEWEARAVAALNHPNIVAVFDVGHDEAFSSYMVTELVEGESLRGVHLSLRKTLDLGVQIAGGLAAAHEAGIVHRDLKPENILLTRDGRVKILDFGLAKVTPSRPAAVGTTETMTVQTEPGLVMGTVGYMSPEQVRGLDVDHRADIFSFGVILYELIACKRAFAGETSVDVMQAILRQDPAELPETVAPGVRQIVARCLEKDPLNRFQSARDLSFALTQSSVSSGSTPTLARRRSFPVWAWVAAAALSGAALALIGAYAWRAPAAESWTGVLLGGPEIAMSPRISPDGHTLAFITIVDGNTQVGVMKPQSANWTVLTHKHDGGFINVVSWSPDGTKIYFDRNAEVPLGIFTVPVLGGEEQPVLEDAQWPEALSDGSLLVVKLNAHRRNQLYHFSPDTGHLQDLPVEPRSRGSVYSSWSLRAFPDGKAALVTGVAVGADQKAGSLLYRIELATGRLHVMAVPFRSPSLVEAVSITHDGQNLVLAGLSGNVSQVAILPAKGGTARTLLTLTMEIHGIDAGLDGSIYVDQNEPTLSALRLPAAGGHAEKLDTFPSAQPNSAALLKDGRVVIADRFAGHEKLMALEPGKDPTPLINTTEETADPVTVAGPREVAFLIGPEPRRTIGMATVANGRIVRRIPLNLGAIDSLAASPDGTTLFCAAGGSIWKVPIDGGAPVQLRAGDSVAMEPGGEKLLVQVNDPPRMRLFETPLKGGVEREIPLNGPLYLSNDPISSNEIGKDGRMVVPLVSSDSWFYLPGIIDLKTGQTSLIPSDHAGDYHWLGWAPDGRIIAAAFDLRSTMWRFTREGE